LSLANFVAAASAPNDPKTLARVTVKWNHLIDKDLLKIKVLEPVRIEKTSNFFGTGTRLRTYTEC
jgi:hypothetical protein